MPSTTLLDSISDITAKDFLDAICLASEVLENERKSGRIAGGKVSGAFVEIEIPENLVVVSDLHGDLKSLLSILKEIDYERFLSNPRNKMVFLGDYVDRGSRSVEVLYAVCRLKCRYPDSVILMRGNHEAPAEFPFPSHDLPYRIIDCFGEDDSKRIYSKVLAPFRLLSLATLVRGELLLVHGGVPTNVQKMKDFRKSIADAQDNCTRERTMEEILWNDPRAEISGGSDWEASRRGIGRHFGNNISKEWLNIAGVKAIVRGHEPCRCFRIDHDGMVLTLFSCKEAYPRFEPAYLAVSGSQLGRVSSAFDLAPAFVKKIL